MVDKGKRGLAVKQQTLVVWTWQRRRDPGGRLHKNNSISSNNNNSNNNERSSNSQKKLCSFFKTGYEMLHDPGAGRGR